MKLFYPLYGSPEPKVALVGARIVLASDASVSSFSGKGISSVSKTGTGEYTITLSDKFNKLLGGGVVALGSSVSDVVTQIESENVVEREIVVMTHDGSAKTDTAVAQELCLNLVLTKSSVA